MRLIDADKVDFFDYIEPYELPWAEKCLADMPTVQAIPVEWLLDWNKKNGNDYVFANSVIPNMLEDWRKENEID